jgi:hypothetical protein
MDKETILKLLEDDDLGLLKTKPKVAATTADDRLIASFQEITEFVRKNGRLPDANPKDVMEFRLYSRLKGFNEDPQKILALTPYDELTILKPTKPIESIEDVFSDDDLGLLGDDAESIFTLKHVPKFIEKPDYVAQRKPCQDFEQFEPLFKECQAALAKGKRKISPFMNEQQIYKGQFFVLKGILLYVAEEGEREITGGKVNARLRCIFENGTESDMLLRSLAAELYKDGRRVSAHEDHLLDSLQGITEEDQETGYIYILRSLSKNSEIASIQNLYKIGFSKQPIESRIKHAETEPTFLMAPVKLIESFQCYNLNPQKLELFLHTFFGEACLNIDIYDADGKRYVPREWFVAPLEVIEQAIQLLINGEIIHYKYDAEKQEISLKTLCS